MKVDDVLKYTSENQYGEILGNFYCGNDFSEESWIKIVSYPGSPVFFLSHENAYQYQIIEDSVNTGNTQIDFVWIDSILSENTITVENNIAAGEWRHLAQTYDSTTSSINIYNNGVVVPGCPVTHSFNLYAGKQMLLEYESVSSPTGELWILMYRYWNTVLSQATISSISGYYDIDASIHSNLLSYYIPMTNLGVLVQERSLGGNYAIVNPSDAEAFPGIETESPSLMTAFDANAYSINLDTQSLEVDVGTAMFGQEFTIEFYAKIDASAVGTFLTQTGGDGLHIVLNSLTYDWYFGMPITTYVISSGSLTASTWTYCAFLSCPKEQLVKIWLDDTKDPSSGMNEVTHTANVGGIIKKAQSLTFNSDDLIDLRIRNFKIWNKILTTDYLYLFQFNQIYPRDFPELVLYLRFDEDDSLTFSDYTDNNIAILTTLDASYWDADNNFIACQLGTYFDKSSTSCKTPSIRRVNMAADLIEIDASAISAPIESQTITMWLFLNVIGGSYACRVNQFELLDSSNYLELILHYGSNDITFTSTAASSTSKWTYIGFSMRLFPFYNSITLGEYESEGLSTEEAYLDCSAETFDIGHCKGDTDSSTISDILILDLRVWSTYKNLIEIYSWKYRQPSFTRDLIFYANFISPYDGTDIYDLVSHSVIDTLITYDDDPQHTNLICPNSKRSPKGGNCVDRGTIILRTGSGEIIELDCSTNILLNSVFTMETIIKISGTHTEDIYLFKRNGSFKIGLDSNSLLFIIMYDSSGSEIVNLITSSAIISSLSFHHLCITYSTDEEPIFEDTTDELELSSGTGQLWLSEFRIWSRKLLQPEISSHSFSSVNPIQYGDSLLVYYKFDESGGFLLHDFRYPSDELTTWTSITDLNGILGITWDNTVSSDLKICDSNMILINQQCVYVSKAVKFYTDGCNPLETSEFILNNEYTIELWVMFYGQSSKFTIIHKIDQMNLQGELNTHGLIDITFVGKEGESNIEGKDSLSIQGVDLFQWAYVAISNSGLVSSSALFVEVVGQDYQSLIEKCFYYEGENISKMCLGSYCDTTDYTLTMNGLMKEVRVWNTFRGVGQIKLQMHSKLYPAEELYLFGYWKIEEGYSSTIFDMTSNGLDIEFPATAAPLWISISDDEPIICEVEESYDDEFNSCESVNILSWTVISGDDIDLRISSEESEFEELTFDFWMYLVSSGPALEIEWPNRLMIELAYTYNLMIHLLGPIDHYVDLISSIPRDNWLAYHIAFSSLMFQIDYFVMNMETGGVLEYVNKYYYHEFPSEDPGSVVNIVSSAFEGSFKQLRIWDVYKEFNPSTTLLEKFMEPTSNIHLMSYYPFSNHAGNILHDISLFGTVTEYSNSYSIIGNIPVLRLDPCPDLYFYEDGICKQQIFTIKYYFYTYQVICNPSCSCTDQNGDTCELGVNGDLIPPNLDIKFLVEKTNDIAIITWEIEPVSTIELISDELMIIRANSLPEAKSFSVKVIKINQNGSQIAQSISFKTKKKFQQGGFVSTPSEGIGYTTEFELIGRDWKDEEYVNNKFQYQFLYQLQESDIPIPLNLLSSLTKIDVRLEPGIKTQNYKVYLLLKVVDSFQVENQMTIGIFVKPEAELENNYEFVKDQFENLKPFTPIDDEKIMEILRINTLGASFLLQYDDSSEINLCNNRSTYNSQTETFICSEEYSSSKDCSLDSETQILEYRMRKMLLENLQETIDTDSGVLLSTTDASELFTLNKERILRNQYVQIFELNSYAADMIESILSLHIDIIEDNSMNNPTLEKLLVRIFHNMSYITQYYLFSCLSHLLNGFTYEVKLETTNSESAHDYLLKTMDLFKSLQKIHFSITIPGDVYSINTSKFNLEEKVIKAKDFGSNTFSTPMDYATTIEFPSNFGDTLNEDDAYVLYLVDWKTFGFPSTSIPEDYSQGSVYITSIDIFSLSDFEGIEVDLSTQTIELKLTLKNPTEEMKSQSPICGYYSEEDEIFILDDAQIQTGNLENSNEIYSVTCNTPHLTSFGIFFKEVSTNVAVSTIQPGGRNKLLAFCIVLSCLCGILVLHFIIRDWKDNHSTKKKRVLPEETIDGSQITEKASNSLFSQTNQHLESSIYPEEEEKIDYNYHQHLFMKTNSIHKYQQNPQLPTVQSKQNSDYQKDIDIKKNQCESDNLAQIHFIQLVYSCHSEICPFVYYPCRIVRPGRLFLLYLRILAGALMSSFLLDTNMIYTYGNNPDFLQKINLGCIVGSILSAPMTISGFMISSHTCSEDRNWKKKLFLYFEIFGYVLLIIGSIIEMEFIMIFGERLGETGVNNMLIILATSFIFDSFCVQVFKLFVVYIIIKFISRYRKFWVAILNIIIPSLIIKKSHKLQQNPPK